MLSEKQIQETRKREKDEEEFILAMKNIDAQRCEWEQWHRLATPATEEKIIAGEKPASAITVLTQIEEQLPTEELIAPAPVIAITVPDGRLEEPTAKISVAPASEPKPDQSIIPQQPATISQTGRQRKKKELTNEETVELLLSQREEIYFIRESQREKKEAMAARHKKEIARTDNDEAKLAVATRHNQEIAELANQHFVRLNRRYAAHGADRKASGIDIKAFWEKMGAAIAASADAAWPAIKRFREKKCKKVEKKLRKVAGKQIKGREKLATKKAQIIKKYEPSEFLSRNIVSLVKKEETREALVLAIKRQVKNIGQPTSSEPPITIADANLLLGRIWEKVEDTGKTFWLKKFCLTKECLAKLILVASNSRDLVMQGKFPSQNEWDEEKLSDCLEKMDELIELGISLFVLWEKNKRRRSRNKQP